MVQTFIHTMGDRSQWPRSSGTNVSIIQTRITLPLTCHASVAKPESLKFYVWGLKFIFGNSRPCKQLLAGCQETRCIGTTSLSSAFHDELSSQL